MYISEDLMEYLFGIKYVTFSKQKPLISITNIIITLYNIISFANSLLSGVHYTCNPPYTRILSWNTVSILY